MQKADLLYIQDKLLNVKDNLLNELLLLKKVIYWFIFWYLIFHANVLGYVILISSFYGVEFFLGENTRSFFQFPQVIIRSFKIIFELSILYNDYFFLTDQRK